MGYNPDDLSGINKFKVSTFFRKDYTLFSDNEYIRPDQTYHPQDRNVGNVLLFFPSEQNPV